MTNDNVQSHASENTAFTNAVPLAPRNRKELALFFRLRKTTVMAMIAASAVIVVAVCVALCTFSLALHYTIKSNVMSATQFCGLLAFGLVTTCAFVAAATLLTAAFRATRAIHAALNPPLLRATSYYGKASEAATSARDGGIEHFWHPPAGSTDAQQSTRAHFSESVTALGNKAKNTEIQVTSVAVKGLEAAADQQIITGGLVSCVPASHGCQKLYPSLEQLRSVNATAAV